MQKEKDIRRVTIAGMLLNIILAAVKFVVGTAGNSQAVIADAFHSLSDIVSDIALIVGIKFWGNPPDDDHPYGHQKIESIVTLFIGILLMLVAVKLVWNAVDSFGNSRSSDTLIIAVAGPLLSIVFKELLYRVTVIIGKRHKSPAVIANAWHHRSDSISSVPALIAVVVTAFFPKLNFVDQIGAVVVSLFILKVSFDIAKPAFEVLTDRTHNAELIASIEKELVNNHEILSFHKIRARNAGGNYFVDLHIQVNGKLTVMEGHRISSELKYSILKSNEDIVDVLIHLEPFARECLNDNVVQNI
ncbi:MAG TPA: cation diffusion facilitator family transporter [Spirochaetota bacterium]|nr:cation diffusion facilitator family transporter [Spirochaetota bacterium]